VFATCRGRGADGGGNGRIAALGGPATFEGNRKRRPRLSNANTASSRGSRSHTAASRRTELLGTWELKRSEPPTRQPTDAAHAHIHRSEDGLVCGVSAFEYPRLPHIGMDSVFPERERESHAYPSRHPGVGFSVGAHSRPKRGADGIFGCTTTSAVRARKTITSRLRRCWRRQRRKRIAAAGGRTTTSDLSYFNVQLPAARRDCRSRLAGSMAATLNAMAKIDCAIRAGQELTHFKLLRERRGPVAADGSSVLEGRPRPGAEHLRRWMMAHSMQAKRRAAAAAICGLQRASLWRDDRREPTKPESCTSTATWRRA